MDNTFTDVFGNELNIGDEVATTIWGGDKSKSYLQVAKVIGFSEQKVRIQYINVMDYDYKTKTNVPKTTTKYGSQLSKRYEQNIFKDSQDFLVSLMGLEEAIGTAKYIYEEEVSRMDY